MYTSQADLTPCEQQFELRKKSIKVRSNSISICSCDPPYFNNVFLQCKEKIMEAYFFLFFEA